MPAADDDQPVLTAAELLTHRRARRLVGDAPSPDAAVLCYSRAALAHTRRRFASRRLGGLMGDVRVLHRVPVRVALAGEFGIGGPAAGVMVEDLVALGARRFVLVGTAGALQPDLSPGDVVVVDRAVRDEGTSRHYLANAPDVAASPALGHALMRVLERSDLRPRAGATWTTDAPYRERRADVRRHQEARVLTVEMEAAALFAVGQALGVETGAALVVADTLAGGRWRLDVDQRPIEQKLCAVIETVVTLLTQPPVDRGQR